MNFQANGGHKTTEEIIYVAIEIDRATFEHLCIHQIRLSDEKRYTQIVSLEAFRTGKRKNASKADIAANRAACCWAPNKLYSVKLLKEWEHENAVGQKSYTALKKTFPQVPKPLNPATLPHRDHSSVWEFYKAIGFDYKARRYNSLRMTR